MNMKSSHGYNFKFSHPFLFACLLITLLINSGCGGGSKTKSPLIESLPKDENAELRKELLELSSAIARKTNVKNNHPLHDNVADVTANIFSQNSQLKIIESENRELSLIKTKYFSYLQNKASFLQQIKNINENKPNNTDLIADLGMAFLEDSQNQKHKKNTSYRRQANFGVRSVKRLKAEFDMDKIRSQLRANEIYSQNAKKNLFALCKNKCSSKEFTKKSTPIVSWDYLYSWCGVYSNDSLTIKNISKKKLTDCVCFFEIKADNSSKFHLHYIKHLAPGKEIQISYRYHDGDYLASETLCNIKEVNFHIFEPELGRLRSASLKIDQAYKEKQAQKYCNSTKFTGSFLPTKPGILEPWNRGIQFQYNGVSRLPVSHVKVTMHSRSGKTFGLNWIRSKNDLKPNTNYMFRDKRFSFDPTKYVVTLRFRGVNYQHKLTWNIK